MELRFSTNRNMLQCAMDFGKKLHSTVACGEL